VNVTNSTTFGHCLEIPFEIGELFPKKLSYRIASLSVRIAFWWLRKLRDDTASMRHSKN